MFIVAAPANVDAALLAEAAVALAEDSVGEEVVVAAALVELAAPDVDSEVGALSDEDAVDEDADVSVAEVGAGADCDETGEDAAVEEPPAPVDGIATVMGCPACLQVS